ncbi:MAG: hypothetical protein NT129_00335 [Candidatus Aenigmarchaeota archaeon]|nr:hypothetical protein [Candidatus Aenigmarchaeota archaeon]
MVDWKNTIKKAGAMAGKGIIKGTKIVAKEVEKTAKNITRKDAILNRMADKQIMQMARDFGIKPSVFFDEKPMIGDYRRSLSMNLSLDKIIDYARRRGVRVDDIIEKVDADKTIEEIETYKKQGIANIVFEVANAIREFKPSRYYSKEFPYQIELKGFLTHQFPTAKIEEAKGSTRPDITISGIAIEVKGPTYEKDLITISDKCMRYPEYFKTGIIIVLFNVEVNEKRFRDWERGLKKTFPNIIVIRK